MRLIPEGSGLPIAELEGGAFIVEEARRYRLVLDEDRPAQWVRFGGRALELEEAPNTFVLELSHWVGWQQLEVQREEGLESVQVQVIPRESKLAAHHWPLLLGELDRWLPGVTAGLEGGLDGSVGRHGAAGPFLALALLPLVPELEGALARLVATPREALVPRSEEVRAHAIQRVDAAAIRWLASHREAARAVLEPSPGEASPRVPRVRGELSVDHAANRYVAWLMRGAIRALRELSMRLGALSQRGRSGATDGGLWCAQRAEEAQGAALRLEHQVRRGFLRELPPEPLGDAALSAILDDPLYARVHALAVPFSAPRFRLESDAGAPAAPVRPSYELYELWVLLAVGRLLQQAFPEARATWRGLSGLREPTSTGSGAGLTLELPGTGQLHLLFNPTFPGYFNRGQAKRHSLSTERRPDLVLTWRPSSGEGRWLILDAKYRVSRSNLGDAFSSIHLYRDSLLWPDLGGRAAAAFLVAPARGTDTAAWFEPAFLREHGLGVLRLAPGADAEPGWLAPVLTALGLEGC